jgi:hypothetical protein
MLTILVICLSRGISRRGGRVYQSEVAQGGAKEGEMTRSSLGSRGMSN